MHTIFDKIDVKDIKDNPVKMIGYEWFLISAGTVQKFNTMTAAWGGIGFLWKKPVVFCFIRPTRHTFSFVENLDFFSLCFFEEKYKDILNYCGSHSGKDVDKVKNTGLTPLSGDHNTVVFKQSRLIFECKKVYYDDINPNNFLDNSIDKLYNNDYHRMYVGEILSCLKKKD